jgi:hypothetical protein
VSPDNALLLMVVLVVAAAVAALVIALAFGPSNPPAAWWIRGLAGAAGTLLLALAVMDPEPITEAADRLFQGEPGPLAAGNAEVMARLLLVVAALSFLLVPGTWMDVAAGTLVALAVAGFVGHYKDTEAILACPKEPVAPTTTPDPSQPVNSARQCPTPTPEGRTPQGVEIAVGLPKDKLVAPLSAIETERAVIRPVLEVRSDEGLRRTVTHKYEVGLAGTVPAKTLTEDVVVHIDTREAAEDLLADVTAAKTIYLTPY